MSYFLMRSKSSTYEPVTLQQAFTQCHANAGVEDEWFLARIRAGRERVEDFTQRALLPQTWVLNYDENAPSVVTLPRSPVMKIKNVLANGIYIDPTPKVLEGLPSRINIGGLGGGSLRVEYVAGYGKGKIPAPLIDAILLYVSWGYENRAAETEIPKAFYDLIHPYRLWV